MPAPNPFQRAAVTATTRATDAPEFPQIEMTASGVPDRPRVYDATPQAQLQRTLGVAGAGGEMVRTLAAGKGMGAAVNKALMGPVPMLAMMTNPAGRVNQMKADAEYVQNARKLDQYAGRPQFRKTAQAEATIARLRARYFAKESAPAVEDVAEIDKPPASFAVALAEGRMETPMDAAAEVKVSGRADIFERLAKAAKGIFGPVQKIERKFPTRVEVPKMKGIRRPDKDAFEGLTEAQDIPGHFAVGETKVTEEPNKLLQALLTVPVAATGVGAVMGAHRGIRRGLDELNESGRFERAWEGFDPEAYGDPLLAERFEEDPSGVEDAFRESFALLNRYAPSVARDPVLAQEYMKRLTQDPTMKLAPEQYLKEVQRAVDLENAIQRARPSLFEGIGSVPVA